MYKTEDLVRARMGGEQVSSETTTLLGVGGSEATFRLAGGYIEDLSLVCPKKSQRGSAERVISVLYSDANKAAAKRSASHSMSPAGPYEGLGGQHGAARWLDWHMFQLDDSIEGYKRAAFQAKRDDTDEALLRYVELGTSHIQLQSTVHSPYDTALQTSIGEHLYFNQPKEIKYVKLDGVSIDEFFSDDTALEKLDQGEALALPIPSYNTLKIDLPGLPSIELATQVSGGGIARYFAELWVWRREGSEGYVCIEPVVGVHRLEGDELDNQMLHIAPGSLATLTSKIRIL